MRKKNLTRKCCGERNQTTGFLVTAQLYPNHNDPTHEEFLQLFIEFLENNSLCAAGTLHENELQAFLVRESEDAVCGKHERKATIKWFKTCLLVESYNVGDLEEG